jgi:hypothetical protein
VGLLHFGCHSFWGLLGISNFLYSNFWNFSFFYVNKYPSPLPWYQKKESDKISPSSTLMYTIPNWPNFQTKLHKLHTNYSIQSTSRQ